MSKLSKEWVKLAGAYESACNAVRRADHDSSVSDDEYAELISAREEAFAKLRQQNMRDHEARK